MPDKTLAIPRLAGLSIRLLDGTLVTFTDDPTAPPPAPESSGPEAPPDSDDGGAGVREPRRPKPQSPSAAAASVPTPALLAGAK